MHDHQEKHISTGTLLKDIVIGMSDGLTVPFALAAGLSGAVDSNQIIITAGVAEIVAGSIAMGLGGYMAGKTEVEHYDNELAREYHEIEFCPDKEKQEIAEILEGYGLSVQSQNQIVEELSKNKDHWADFMMRFELGLEKPATNRAFMSAITIATSYIVGGIIPLTGYMIADTPHDGLLISACITITCLLVFGYFKSKMTGQNVWKGALQVAFIGTLASSAAYLLAKLLS